jgi:hypothetical protein
VEEQVFGGYISTCNVNEDLTILTLECADRVIDLYRRYSLSEIKLKGYKDSEELDYQGLDFLKNYNNYGDALKFLLKTCEIPFNNNIKNGEGIVREKKYKLASYGKNGYKNFNLKNILTTPNNGYVTVHNGADRLKGQSITIFNAGNKKIHLNSYPNLYMDYGL